MKSFQNRQKKGFTLIEIMVTITILVILVGFLVVMVKSASNTWKKGERQAGLFARSRRIFEIFKEDLSSLAVPYHSIQPNIQFLGDHDFPYWHSRLRFVRTISGESSWFLTREGGKQILPEHFLDLQDDYLEAKNGSLKASSGLMEVIYMMDPTPGSHSLLRGIRSPIGGKGSLFLEKNLKNLSKMQVLAENILYVEYRFWSPWSRTWKLPLGKTSLSNYRKSPLLYWDSTRKTLPKKKYASEKKKFPLLWPYKKNGTYFFLPSKILLVLVFRDPEFLPDQIILIKKLSKNDKILTLSSTAKLSKEREKMYLLIHEEWIRYESIRGNQVFLGKTGTRGARLTLPKNHPFGSSVELGKTFRWVIHLPCETWSE